MDSGNMGLLRMHASEEYADLELNLKIAEVVQQQYHCAHRSLLSNTNRLEAQPDCSTGGDCGLLEDGNSRSKSHPDHSISR